MAPLLMIATGMCLVIATGGIDLSVGSMMAVGGAVAMEYLSNANASDSIGAAAVAILLAVGLCAVLGAINGVLIAVVGLQPFITTLVMMLAGRGLAKVITGGQNTTAVNERYRWIANGYVLGLPVVFLLGHRHRRARRVRSSGARRSGMMIESIGINAEASRLAGLNRRALLITVYMVSAFLAGIAGIFSTGTVMTVDVSQTGYQFELDAILAVVIGGTSLAGGKFSLAGAAIGALLIATLDKTVVFLGVPASATPGVQGGRDHRPLRRAVIARSRMGGGPSAIAIAPGARGGGVVKATETLQSANRSSPAAQPAIRSWIGWNRIRRRSTAIWRGTETPRRPVRRC